MKKEFLLLLGFLFLLGAGTAVSVSLHQQEELPDAEYVRKNQLESLRRTAITGFYRGNYAETERILRTLIRQQREDLPLFMLLALTVFESGRIGESERILHELAQHHPDNAEIHNNLGVVMLWQYRYDAARRELQKATELEPENPRWRSNLSIAESAIAMTFLRRNYHIEVSKLEQSGDELPTTMVLKLTENRLFEK